MSTQHDHLLDLKTRELRTIVGSVEARTSGDEPNGRPTEITGYASLFETPATIAGQFVEIIERGAFDIEDADVRVLFNHDPSLLLGRTKSGTATLAVDDRGLRYAVQIPPTSLGRDLAALVARGDVDGSSFGFRVMSDRWEPGATAEDLPVRHVERVELIDVSPVTTPAYSETTAEARQCADAVDEHLATMQAEADAADLADRRLTYARNRAAVSS